MSSSLTPTASPSTPPERLIEPREGWTLLEIRELWDYRELLYFFIWRDIKVRYKQTLLGAAWAILQPLLTMVVFSLFFGKLAKVPSDGVPYPIFSFAALVPWTFFSTGLSQSANSLVGAQNLIKKIYFPRLLIPMGSVLAGAVDLVLAMSVLLLMMLYYGFYPTPRMLVLIPLVALASLTALGAGMLLSALNVQYRDVRYVLPFMVQIWLFATPIAYPSSLLEEPWRTLYGINPMVSVVEGFRWALLDTGSASPTLIALSVTSAVIIAATGLYYFSRTERRFADIL
ncbi:MAG: ABC transporter permease [Acidobacteriota bacterium]